MICQTCLKTCRSPHFTQCNKLNLSKLDFKIEFLKFNLPILKLENDNELKRLYLENEMSFPDLIKHSGTSSKTLYFLLDYFNIKTRTRSEAIGGEKATLKRESTFIKNYGKKNPLSKGTSAYLKRNKTVQDRYGVSNVRHLQEVKDKITQTHIERYGVKRVISTNTFGSPNKLESRIASTLASYDIPFTFSYILKGKQFDFRVGNVLIEIHGDFWHCNPTRFKSGEFVQHPGGEVLVDKIWAKDKNKETLATKEGFHLLVFWESDIKNKSDVELWGVMSNLILNKLDIVLIS